MTTMSREYIVATPGTCGGKPRIAGHRVRVSHIAVEHEDMGMSARRIIDAHPTLTLAEVHAALAYYYDNRDAICGEIEEEQAFYERMRREQPSLLREKLKRKMERRGQRVAQDPPR